MSQQVHLNDGAESVLRESDNGSINTESVKTAPKKSKKQQVKIKRRAVHGVLLLDKPIGLTSNQALQKVKHLYGAEKAGHTGSLDPLATGMLPICFGEATKFSQIVLDSDKTYLTRIQLGQKTDTADSEGQIILEQPIPEFTQAHVESIIAQKFIGLIWQTPPAYSALKKDGQPLYKLARAGVEVDMSEKRRQITIESIDCLECEKDTITLKVTCSKGTYIRSLVEDIAVELGTVGHVIMLRRLNVKGFHADQMISLAKIEEISEKCAPNTSDLGSNSVNYTPLDSMLMPVHSPLQDWVTVHVAKNIADDLRFGRRISLKKYSDDVKVVSNTLEVSDFKEDMFSLGTEVLVFEKLTDQAELFIGIAQIDKPNVLAPKRLVNLR